MGMSQPKFQDTEQYQKCIDFLQNELIPFAQNFDTEQQIPKVFFQSLAKAGYLGAIIPKNYGGQEMDYMTLGYIHEEFGKVLASVENALTVFSMVTRPLIRFGTKLQRNYWLPRIAKGDTIVAIALTEPDTGSDLKKITTFAEESEDYYCLNGVKKYITLGQIADLFLVLARCEDEFITLLVEKKLPGISITPLNDFFGLRSNLLAEIEFKDCRVAKENRLGAKGAGLAQVIACALDEGRYTTAWGCVGIGQACLDLAQQYCHQRSQFGSLLKDHQLIQKKLTEIIVNVKAARSLCSDVGELREAREITYIGETLIAKYFSANMAVTVAKNALDVFGAVGFTKNYSMERFYRDAHMMEVIEGTAQMYEIMIPKL